MRILIVSILIIIALITIYIGYLYFSYIDVEHNQGEAYGFTIGTSKKDVHQKALSIYAEKKVYILYPLDGNNHGPHKKIVFSIDDYQLLKNQDSWKIYFNKGYYNFIELKFEDQILVSIYRHRKNFELP